MPKRIYDYCCGVLAAYALQCPSEGILQVNMAIDRMHALLENISESFHLDVLASKTVISVVDSSLNAHGKHK